MHKFGRFMLLSGVAVFGLTACGDDVTVVEGTPPAPTPPPVVNVVNPTVTIASVNSNSTGNPVNLSNVAGQVDVVVNINPGSYRLARVDVLLGTTVVASQTFTTAQIQQMLEGAVIDGFSAQLSGQIGGVQTVTISIPTDQLTAAGAPAFPNATYALSVRATFAPGTGLPTTAPQNPVVTSTNTLNLTFNNASQLIASFSNTSTRPAVLAPAGGVATGPDLMTWRQGNLTISVRAASFTGVASNAASLPGQLVKIDAAGAVVTGAEAQTIPVTLTRVGTTNEYTATLSSAIAGVTGRFQLGLVGDASTAVGPVVNPIVRIDNVQPAVGATAPAFRNATPFFTNASFTFNAATSGSPFLNLGTIADSMPGVGGTQTKFFVGTPANVSTTLASSTLAGLTALTEVTSTAALPATLTNDQYRVLAVVYDNLGNFRAFGSPTFGVDIVAPTGFAFSAPTPADSARLTVAPTVGFNSTNVLDNASGFGTNRYRVSVAGLTAGGQICPVGSGGSATCAAVAQGDAFAFTPTVAGYYTVNSQLADTAGNLTTVVARRFLFDAVAPAFTGGLTIPNQIVPGTSVTFNPTITDNLDLDDAFAVVGFASGVNARFAMADIGSFGEPLTTTASPALTIASFPRSFQLVGAGGTAPAAPAAGTVEANTVIVRAMDVAGNMASVSQPIPSQNLGGTTQNWTGLGINTFTITAPAGGFDVENDASIQAGGAPETVDLVAEVLATGLDINNPFTSMVFWYQDPMTGDFVQIGAATVGVTTNAMNERVFRYTFPTWNPPASLGTGASVNIIATGIRGANILGSGLVSIDLVN